MSVEPGTFVTTVVDHGVVELGGNMAAQIRFASGHVYVGWLTEKALPYTSKNLVNAGFNGTKIEQLNIDGAIDPTRKVEIVAEQEEYEGKSRVKVKFINRVREKATAQDIAVKLGGMNIDAELAAAREEAGVKGAPVVARTPLQSAEITTDDIPF